MLWLVSTLVVLAFSVEGKLTSTPGGFCGWAERKLAGAVELYTQRRFSACASHALGLEKAKLNNRDAAMFVKCQCLFYAGRKAKAYKCFSDMQELFPRSQLMVLAAYRIADCAKELGKDRKAILRYQRAANLGSDPRVDPAVGLFYRTRFALQSGNLKQARRVADELRGDFPDHPLTDKLASMVPWMGFDVELALRMASKLHARRKWNRALAVLNRAQHPEKPELRFELAYREGRILFDLRERYQDSYKKLIAARDHAPDPVLAERAWFYASRALGRLDRDDEAIASHLAMVNRYPKGRLAGQALFYAGWLELNQGRCAHAIPLLLRVSREYPKTNWADQARWFVAWCQLQAEQWQEAIHTLAPLTRFSDTSVGAQANYWTGVAYQAMELTDRAQIFWRRTITRSPLTWYALLARVRLGKLAPAMESPKASEPGIPIADRLFEQAQELSRVGLKGMAVRLLRENEKGFLSRHRNRSARHALLSTYHRVGHFHRPWLLAVSREAKSLRRLPTSTTLPIWEFSYPLAIVNLVRDHTDSDFSLALFLSAIMRTESGFDPLARSVADARGLMQMMPQRAEKIARQMGIPYTQGDLFDPEYNLRLSSWYVGRLVKKFHHQWPLVASAYNAGSSAVKSWCRKNGHMKLDAFIEAIPWSESRRYAKRVCTAFARYTYLTGSDLPELSLEINPSYLEDGLED